MKTHGHRAGKRTPTYSTWRAMKQRCLNSNHDRYECYGGRGITVCPAWMGFEAFLRDMGERPKGSTLDRVDANGPYTKENCRWADRFTQDHNKPTDEVF